jgi:outer membrane protein assembly factor BamB
MRFLFVFLLAVSALAEDWPQFRGPRQDGKSSANIPLTWSETNNVKWKTAIHGKAWSCPVVQGDQMWVTTATKDGKQLSVVKLDAKTGKIEKDTVLFEVEAPQFCHDFNSYASPTPVIEGDRIYVTFGSPGTACLDAKTAEKIWERRDFVCNHFRGAGSSPVIYRDLLIMHFDGSDNQFIVALDKNTGKTVWKTDRSIDHMDLKNGKPEADGDYRKAFSTPVVTKLNGKDAVISLASKALYAYEPMTGKELWRVEERKNHSGSAQPAIADGMLFSNTGFSKSEFLAINLDDRSIAWRSARNIPNKPSVIVDKGLIYMVDDGGIVSCLDAKSGQEFWRERVQGNYSASPLLVNDRLYIFSEQGKATVLQAGKEFKPLATNMLSEGFMATPAIAGNAIFLRTKTDLYRVEQQ